MKKIVLLAALISISISLAARGEDVPAAGPAAPAAPAASAAIKIGCVNLDEVMRGYGKAERMLARLESEMKEKEAETEKLVAEIKKLKAEKDLLSSEARMKKEEEILEKTMALKKFRQDVEESLEMRIATERKKLEKEIRDTVQAKAKAMGYSLVFVGELVLYKDPALDITKEVLAELNKNN